MSPEWMQRTYFAQQRQLLHMARRITLSLSLYTPRVFSRSKVVPPFSHFPFLASSSALGFPQTVNNTRNLALFLCVHSLCFFSVTWLTVSCCSVLQRVGVRCMLQCVTVSCSELQRVVASCSELQRVAVNCSVLQCAEVRCRLQDSWRVPTPKRLSLN